VSITLSRGLRLAGIGRYMHWCPGCKEAHFFVLGVGLDGRRVDFNGDLQNPTFSPDQRVERDEMLYCRYFLTNGQLEFMGECGHEYRNRTVPLPDFPMQPLQVQPEPRS
jgi:hypothetical protein